MKFIPFLLCSVNENDRDSYPEAYLKIWDHAKKTNSLYAILKAPGLPPYAVKDMQENGGAMIYGGANSFCSVFVMF